MSLKLKSIKRTLYFGVSGSQAPDKNILNIFYSIFPPFSENMIGFCLDMDLTLPNLSGTELAAPNSKPCR